MESGLKIKEIKITNKMVKISKIILLLAIIFAIATSIFKINYNNAKQEKYEQEMLELFKKSSSLELHLALQNIKMVNGNKQIVFNKDNHMILKDSDVESFELKYVISNITYGPPPYYFTVVGNNIETNYERIFEMEIIPSKEKFESKIRYDGLIYNLVYSSEDITNQNDLIFNFIDVNDDGVIDTDLYEKFHEDSEIKEITFFKEKSNSKEDTTGDNTK